MLLIWIIVLLVSLLVLVKSADYFTESSEKIGLAMGLSPFVIGIIIVSVGTSLPELAAAIAAVSKGTTELVAASVIGSNVANILLIVGVASLVAGGIKVSKDLIDLDAPLLAAVTAIFLVVIYDQNISTLEAIVLIATFVIYLFYSIKSEHDEDKEELEEIPVKMTDGKKKKPKGAFAKIPKLKLSLFLILLASGVGLFLGANYTIEAVIALAEILAIPASIVTITVVAIGTSLPELVVSVRAAMKKNFDIALGNIFGSNVFNCVIVAGIPGLMSPLGIDEKTYTVGILFLILATFLFILSGISRRIHIWEGLMFLTLYVLFVVNVAV